MTIKDQIKALRRGNNGAEILSILNTITGGNEQSEYVVTATIEPETGYIVTWDGRQVCF
jgi:hypothetical protein